MLAIDFKTNNDFWRRNHFTLLLFILKKVSCCVLFLIFYIDFIENTLLSSVVTQFHSRKYYSHILILTKFSKKIVQSRIEF